MGIFGLFHHKFFKGYSFHEDRTVKMLQRDFRDLVPTLVSNQAEFVKFKNLISCKYPILIIYLLISTGIC